MENTAAPEKLQPQPSKSWLAILLFLLLLMVAGIALYWLMFRSSPEPGPLTNFFKLTPVNLTEIEDGVELVDYTPVNEAPPEPKITDLDPELSDPSLTKILKGYFYDYDDETKTLQILNRFRDYAHLQQLEVDLSQIVGFYCWPKSVNGESGVVKTSELEFAIDEAETDIYMSDEKFIKLDLFDSFFDTQSFIIIQLREPFELEQTNYVQKLILVGC